MQKYDLIIIGGGPAGLAAALAAKKSGLESILILERDRMLGGILNQCIHAGFGLHTFKEELSGPEYAQRFIDEVLKAKIEYRLNTMVLGISQDKIITCAGEADGLYTLQAKAVILSMGCRERPRGALNIAGSRPAGIYSAGTAQRMMNIDGWKVGKEIVILGSGDIGLIMARRMTLEGAKVKLVAEVMPYSGGLKRNIVQCLDDFGIPLKLSHTVVRIHGKQRLTGVTVAEVDANRKPVPGTEEYIPCDTLLLSVGLLPENELTSALGAELSPVTNGPTVSDRLETGVPGVFACGNVLHVHDLVDYVSEEAALAGSYAAAYVMNGRTGGQSIPIRAQNGVRYTVPQRICVSDMNNKVTVRFRVDGVYRNRSICVYCGDEKIIEKKRRIMSPGEMEQIDLDKSTLETKNGLKEIIIRTEANL